MSEDEAVLENDLVENESLAEAENELTEPPKKNNRGGPRTPGQKEALKRAQAAQRAKGEATRQKKALETQSRAQKARAQRLISSQNRLVNEVAPITALMQPFLDITRQQAEEIQHLRHTKRTYKRGRGRDDASGFPEYDAGSDSDTDARQLERPSEKRGRTQGTAKSKSTPRIEAETTPPPPAASSQIPDDFAPIQRPRTPPPALPQQSAAEHAARSLSLFMSDLGY